MKHRRKRLNIMIKQITRKTAVASILSLTVAYPAYAAVPNTFSAGQAASAADVNENFTSLDSRVGALEAASVNPTNVAIDCGADPSALKSATIKKDTTYDITGACAGPIYVSEDNVHLLGTSNTTDSIMLPAGISESVVWAGGAYNLQITNLFLDLTQTTADTSTGGIWARDAFVRLRDSRIQGGSYGIEPFRGAIVRLDGENSITEFSEAGLSASDQSNINTRGQTTISSTRTENQYIRGIASSRGSSVDVRGGITISLPTTINAVAVRAESNATVRIQNNGIVSIVGDVRSDEKSSVKIEKGMINGEINLSGASSLRLTNGVAITGDIDLQDGSQWYMSGGSITGAFEARRGSVIRLKDVTQTSTMTGAVRLSANSTLSADDSDLGNFSVYANSSIDLEADEGSSSTVNGGEIHFGSVGSIRNMVSTGDIKIFTPGALHLTGTSDLDGNNLYLCGSQSYVESSVTGIANGNFGSDCSP